MKIAIHADGPTIRGNERQVINIAGQLQGRGHEIVVSCRKGGPVEIELRGIGIRTTHIRPRGDIDVWSALVFALWLRRERCDAVLLTSWVRAFIAGWSARVARVPRVVFRIGAIQPIQRRGNGAIERHAIRRCYHAIIANSRRVAEHMIGALPEMADRVHIVVNGIPQFESVGPAPLRSVLGIPDDCTIALAVGGLQPNKGFDLLIDAVSLVPAVHAVLVGGGTDAERKNLEEKARTQGVADRVHLLGQRGDVPALLTACDLFVLASRNEGFSVALLEAMAHAKPILASDVGGTWEGLAAREGRPAAGWIVACDDRDALAAGLQLLFDGIRTSDPEVSARSAEAKWRVENWFTLERMMDGYEAVLAGRV